MGVFESLAVESSKINILNFKRANFAMMIYCRRLQSKACWWVLLLGQRKSEKARQLNCHICTFPGQPFEPRIEQAGKPRRNSFLSLSYVLYKHTHTHTLAADGGGGEREANCLLASLSSCNSEQVFWPSLRHHIHSHLASVLEPDSSVLKYAPTTSCKRKSN